MKRSQVRVFMTVVAIVLYGWAAREVVHAHGPMMRFSLGILMSACFARFMLGIGLARARAPRRWDDALTMAAAVLYGPVMALSSSVETAAGRYGLTAVGGLCVVKLVHVTTRAAWLRATGDAPR